MKITIGFSTTNGWFSRLIRWFTEGKVSHTYIRVYDEYLHTSLIIHADLPGVIIEHAEIFDQKNKVIEEYEINDPRLRKGLKINLKHLRKKYDLWNILNWALVLQFKRWFKRKIEHPHTDPSKLICVDFVIRVLNDSDITHLPLRQMHPKSLRIWFEENHESFDWKKDQKLIEDKKDVQITKSS